MTAQSQQYCVAGTVISDTLEWYLVRLPEGSHHPMVAGFNSLVVMNTQLGQYYLRSVHLSVSDCDRTLIEHHYLLKRIACVGHSFRQVLRLPFQQPLRVSVCSRC